MLHCPIGHHVNFRPIAYQRSHNAAELKKMSLRVIWLSQHNIRKLILLSTFGNSFLFYFLLRAKVKFIYRLLLGIE